MKFGREKQPETSGVAVPRGPSPRLETVIGPNAHFKGDIVSEGGVRVEGIFEGNIETAGNLVIGESAKVIADVQANNISISGNLTINSLLLNEGAYLRGQTTMHADIEPPQLEPPRPQHAAESSPPGPIVDVKPVSRPDL